MPGDENDDSIEINLRSAEEVARRCIILATILQRFTIDANSQEDSEGTAFDLREWLREEGLWDDATANEKAFLLREPGDLEPEDGLDATLNTECLTAIGWALGLHHSLAEDRLDKLAGLVRQVPGPWDRTAPWLALQSLRAESEIARSREAAEVWNWRLEIEPERRAAKGHELRELEGTIRDVTADSMAAGLLARGAGGGFSLGGVSVATMDLDDVNALQPLTQERLLALNWICGFGDDWDNVPLDV